MSARPRPPVRTLCWSYGKDILKALASLRSDRSLSIGLSVHFRRNTHHDLHEKPYRSPRGISGCLFRRKRTPEAKQSERPPCRYTFHCLHSTTPPTEASPAILAMVERKASFQRWLVHRPQRVRLRSSPAAASSARPTRFVPFLDAFPDCGSERSTSSLVPRRRKAGLFQGAAPRAHPISLRPLRSLSTPPPSGRRAARSAPLSTVTVGGSATLPPACGCACSAQRYPAPATDAPTCRNALAAGRTRPNRCARTARTSSMGGMCRPGRARFQDALEARRAGGIR